MKNEHTLSRGVEAKTYQIIVYARETACIRSIVLSICLHYQSLSGSVHRHTDFSLEKVVFKKKKIIHMNTENIATNSEMHNDSMSKSVNLRINTKNNIESRKKALWQKK